VPGSLKVVGEPALQSSLAKAEKGLDTLDSTPAAQAIVARIPGVAPRLTGRLGGSFSATTQDKRGTITTPTVYAVPIHWGRPAHNIAANPFVFRAVESATSAIEQALTAAGQKLCDGVHGA
jgi:hypothetical protein